MFKILIKCLITGRHLVVPNKFRIFSNFCTCLNLMEKIKFAYCRWIKDYLLLIFSSNSPPENRNHIASFGSCYWCAVNRLCVQVAGNREFVSHVLWDTGRQTGEEDLRLFSLPDSWWTGPVKIKTTHVHSYHIRQIKEFLFVYIHKLCFKTLQVKGSVVDGSIYNDHTFHHVF